MSTPLLNKIRKWQHSLTGKLLMRFLICLILFFVLIGSIQFYSLKYILYENVRDNLTSEFLSLRNTLRAWVVQKGLPPKKRFEELSQGHFAALYTTDFKLRSYVLSYGNSSSPPDFPDLTHALQKMEKQEDQQFLTARDEKGQGFMLMVIPISPTDWHLNEAASPFAHGMRRYFGMGPVKPEIRGDGVTGFLVMGAPLAKENMILSQNIRGFTFTALIILALGLLFTAFILKRPLQPLRNISATARRIADGQYDLRLSEEKTSTEIDQLQTALNHMLQQLETALTTEIKAKDRMARFIADASHELRTPLTSLRGYLEILQRNEQTDKADLDLAHHTMLLETERLIRLTEGLLILNRIAQKDLSGDGGTVSLKEVLPDIYPLLTPLLGRRLFTINYDILEHYLSSGQDYILPLSADELKQVLFNLLANAAQHTDENGTIELKIEKYEDQIILSIEDNGNGIAPEDIPHIFERFFRGEKSRARKKGEGAGLGLSIAAEIIQLRGGQISVESEPGKGTTFKLLFKEVSA